MKRLMDISASALGLALLSPLLAGIAIAIVIDSGRPVLFRQLRVGKEGRLFSVLKFRSMQPAGPGSPQVTSAGDERITRVGAWLRSRKLDELPQLWNVLKGELSLVGPRPEVPKYVDLWPADDRVVILSVRPGITDPASLRFRREEELLASQADPDSYYCNVLIPEKVRLYRQYVETQSMAQDLRLIAGTVHSVARH